MSSDTIRPSRLFVGDRPRTRVAAGAVGGFLAGAAFIALLAWFDSTVGKSPFQPFRVVASLVQGPASAKMGTASVALGMLIHSVLSAFFGVGLALLTAPVRRNRSIAVAGVLYGALVYAVNFQVLARFIHQFKALLAGPNQPMVFTVHLVFGALTSLFVMRSVQELGAPGTAGSSSAGEPGVVGDGLRSASPYPRNRG